MSTVTEIKPAIDQLSPKECGKLEARLHPYEDDDWDRQMAEDAKPGGKLYRLIQQSKAEAKLGKLRAFPDDDPHS